jgi:hypothetical protein
MPAPASIFRSIGQQYFNRFQSPVPAQLVRTVPMARLVELVDEAIRVGIPLAPEKFPSKGPSGHHGTKCE